MRTLGWLILFAIIGAVVGAVVAMFIESGGSRIITDNFGKIGWIVLCGICFSAGALSLGLVGRR